jgi:hypothetical protein
MNKMNKMQPGGGRAVNNEIWPEMKINGLFFPDSVENMETTSFYA